MSTDPNIAEAAAKIRARAQMAASGEAGRTVFDGEILASLADGSLPFELIDDSSLERIVTHLGPEGLAQALAERTRPESGDHPRLETSEEPERQSQVVPGGGRILRSWSWRRRPVWIAAGIAAAVLVWVLPSLLLLNRGSERRPPQSESGSTPRDAGSAAGADAAARAPGAAEPPATETTLALLWTRQAAGDGKSWNLPGGRLEQPLPDFDGSRGTGTLGAPSPQLQRWQLSTVIVRSANGWGSGALISADGWLLTNYHVVEETAQKAALGPSPAMLDVILPTIVAGRVKPQPAVRATLYRVDPVHDLALLKLEQPPTTELPHFALASEVHDGEDCVVIGSQANGPAWWVRGGAVSQQFDFPSDLSQFAAGASSDRPTLDRSRLTVVVTDTRVSGGDSGGPLLNSAGELIGLTFATSSNATSGSVGWHVALPHLRTFVATLPTTPEGVPLDAWTAGLGKSVAFDVEWIDGDHDGRVDTVEYVYAVAAGEGSPPRPVARTLFIDFNQRTMKTDAFGDGVPLGLWGTDGGKFPFDLFLMSRADGVAAVGYRNSRGVVDEIRIGRVRQDAASLVWQRDGKGQWRATRPSAGTSLLDVQRLGPSGVARLQAITGEHVVTLPPGRSGERGSPSGGNTGGINTGRGPNKLQGQVP